MRLTKRVGGSTLSEVNQLKDKSALIMWFLIAIGGVSFISVVFNIFN